VLTFFLLKIATFENVNVNKRLTILAWLLLLKSIIIILFKSKSLKV